ncbi:hypothetical protein G5I_00223 [Acromyrmex echinatior]|uniref:Uncharacterized protein n=1 Tax=Acromyrmex echinatior TaxID=103372 RepID=F4W4A9_ACREC|nr:hypothetical protein G5I_00223 [Acromyrmex echinatior]
MAKHLENSFFKESVRGTNNGGLTYRMIQVIMGHSSFEAYLYEIQKEDIESPICQHCRAAADNAVYTLLCCLLWVAERGFICGSWSGSGFRQRVRFGDWGLLVGSSEAWTVCFRKLLRGRHEKGSRTEGENPWYWGCPDVIPVGGSGALLNMPGRSARKRGSFLGWQPSRPLLRHLHQANQNGCFQCIHDVPQHKPHGLLSVEFSGGQEGDVSMKNGFKALRSKQVSWVLPRCLISIQKISPLGPAAA